MTAPPLAIIQARMDSTRLPGKVMMNVGGRSLVRRAWDAGRRAFGREHVVCTVPAKDTDLIEHIGEFGGIVEPWDRDEDDVLGRFWHVAHKYRWHPGSVIVRITPDDPFHDPYSLERVAHGERLPIEKGGEAFTLAQLDRWQPQVLHQSDREHIGLLILGEPMRMPEGLGWTVDTAHDLKMARILASTGERGAEDVFGTSGAL